MSSFIVEGRVLEECPADRVGDALGTPRLRVELGPECIAAKALSESRSKMSPDALRDDLGFFEKRSWVPLTFQEQGQRKTILINIKSAAHRLGFSVNEIKDASEHGVLEELFFSRTYCSTQTQRALFEAPFRDVRVQSREISQFIEKNKQRWFAEVEATGRGKEIASGDLPRKLLITPEKKILMLPNNEDTILGEGAFKKVRKGLDITTAKTIAVAQQIIPAREELFLADARREIAICQSLRGRVGVIDTIAVHEETRAEEVEITIAQDLAESDLSTLMNSGKLTPEGREQIALDILADLLDVHEGGILHRDIKPPNILILTDPQTGQKRAKFTDFGLSCATDDLETRKEISGTPVYYAPEQARALLQRSAPESFGTPEADVYATGLVLGMLFSQELPPWTYTNEDMPRYSQILNGWKPDVPKHLQPIIHQMLNVQPSERPTAQQALEQMRIALGRGG